ncbi:MAG: cupin domain-containing protein [Burkholderiaceae bacterium]
MTEQEYRKRAQDEGYGEVTPREYEPNRDGPMHTHEFSVLVLVTEGVFSLAYEDGVKTYQPGEWCVLPANTSHTERAGPAGAKVLLARKGAVA